MKLQFCEKCGRMILVGFDFCPYCGVAIRPNPAESGSSEDREPCAEPGSRESRLFLSRMIQDLDALDAEISELPRAGEKR